MKATAIAPANIAFIKYWGKKDELLRLPENGSISVNLSNLSTTTTIEFIDSFTKDVIIINGKQHEDEQKRVVDHLDRVRNLAKISQKAKVVSQNNFPIAGGLASSASGFAALTVAGCAAAGVTLSEKELSILARQGSGSACRSIPDGFVEWLDGDTSETSYAYSLYPPKYWDLRILAVVVGNKRKDISSSEGHVRASMNPFLRTRLARMKTKISAVKECLKKKDFIGFGEIIESEAFEEHAIAFTSSPPILYWLPGTVAIIRLVAALRKEGIMVFFTIDAGPHPLLVCQEKDWELIAAKVKEIPGVENIIINTPTIGARLVEKHLF